MDDQGFTCPPGCDDAHSFSGSCVLRWMGPAWEEGGIRWVRDEEGRPTPAKHLHTPADVGPGAVTLCATRATPDGGLQWAHVPVDRWLWADEVMRDGFLEQARREVGSDDAPVEVIE